MTEQQTRRASPLPYGTAKDLPSYQGLHEQLESARVFSSVMMLPSDQQQNLAIIKRHLDELIETVDLFYQRLGNRNWVFHDSLQVKRIRVILSERSDAKAAETALIKYYKKELASVFPILRLLGQDDALRQRKGQLDRAREHYLANQFDSCTMQLIAVMDGFVNDFEPGVRRGLAARAPDEMVAWDSVVGHHMGLTHVLQSFHRTVKSRIDAPVYEVHRHGIMHGSIVNFDNAIVATKAWNMLFAVADWAKATKKAEEPPRKEPSWPELAITITRNAEHAQYRDSFEPSTIDATADPEFFLDPVVAAATRFLESWSKRRWGLIPGQGPRMGSRKSLISITEVKRALTRYEIGGWEVERVEYDTPSGSAVVAHAMVNGKSKNLRFRMILINPEGDLAIPSDSDGAWRLAIWAPHTFFDG